MKFIDFFAGIGGIRLGLERAGHECVGFCEWDKFARQSYKAMHVTEGEWENYDVRTVKPYDVPKADIYCFGFPCVDVSTAGKQKGLKADRSGLFYEIMRILAGRCYQDRPQYLLIENVKNLLSVGRGFDFARVLCEMAENGYCAEWQVLNSKDFGVPQNRERVFVVGHLGDECRGKVFPIFPTNREDFVADKRQKCTVKNVFDVYNRKMRTDGCTGTITAHGNASSTVSGTFAIIEGERVRKLTPRECWRLQGFPDEYFNKAAATGISNSQLYKQAGNAVTVNVAEAIGRKLKLIEGSCDD